MRRKIKETTSTSPANVRPHTKWALLLAPAGDGNNNTKPPKKWEEMWDKQQAVKTNIGPDNCKICHSITFYLSPDHRSSLHNSEKHITPCWQIQASHIAGTVFKILAVICTVEMLQCLLNIHVICVIWNSAKCKYCVWPGKEVRLTYFNMLF